MAKPLRTLQDWAQDGTGGEAEAISAPPGIDTLHSCMCLCVFCVCLCDWTYACMCSLTCKGEKTVSGHLLIWLPCMPRWLILRLPRFLLFLPPFLHGDPWITDAHTCHSTFTHLGDLSSGPCVLNSKCSYPLSRLPSPLYSSSTAMHPPFKGLPLIWPGHLAPRIVASQNSFSLFSVIQFLTNLTCLQNTVQWTQLPLNSWSRAHAGKQVTGHMFKTN